ncbi:hypothetical protein EXS45_01090 [Candidatus Nomurabacteria bacterium]|nr:hypothetical protein [Candidatus Nomurabacteria bacterium]
MENDITTEQVSSKEILHRSKVHQILAHSYSLYFILFLVGVCFDIIFKFKILTSSILLPVGFVFLIFATLLILWAQQTSRNLKIENLNKETFCKGPYCYTRSPTHWGLFLLMLGFGIIANALFIILTTIVSFIISRFVFLEKQENILAQKYGTPYLEYKKSVKI